MGWGQGVRSEWTESELDKFVVGGRDYLSEQFAILPLKIALPIIEIFFPRPGEGRRPSPGCLLQKRHKGTRAAHTTTCSFINHFNGTFSGNVWRAIPQYGGNASHHTANLKNVLIKHKDCFYPVCSILIPTTNLSNSDSVQSHFNFTR
eukprot:sb/3473715/